MFKCIAITLKSWRMGGLVLLVALAIPSNLLARDTITWANDNMPPAFIVDGPEKGNGIVDGVVEIYKAHLPEYDHDHIVGNMARILQMMKNGEKVCYAGFFKTPEREKYIYFSIPNLINYSNIIVVKKSRLKSLFGNKESVSLEALLKNPDLRLGVTRDRSYGGAVDELLKKYKDKNKNIVYRAGQDSLKGLLRMLSAERIDYTIGFPWEVPYVAQQINKRDDISALAIEEGKKDYWIKNYMGCPKNEWGRQMIEKINRILLDVRPTEKHMYHQLKWFPRDMEPQIRKAYKDQILTITP